MTIGRSRFGQVVAGLAAWLAFAIVFGMLIYAQAYGAMGLGLSIRVALLTTFAPAGMSPGIWWLAGRHARRQGSPVRYMLVHLALALVFAGVWAAWMWIVARSGRGARMPAATITHGVLPWQLVMGVLVYGLVASLSYAVRFIGRARTMELAAERAERLRAQAHLAALRAHIDPHFFFNTLHTLSELLLTDAALARSTIERLGEMFRYTLQLDRRKVDVVTVEQEWRVVESYLWLEGLRLGPRLRVRTALDDEALACMIPPFTIQPIVENAVRHGLSPKPSGGTLTVMAREEAGWLRLEVTDDGVGGAPNGAVGSTGLGLRSVRERLQACYDGNAKVGIAQREGGGTTVTIEVPATLASTDLPPRPA